MMAPALDAVLSAAESRFAEISAALLESNPEALNAAAAALREVAMQLAQCLQRLSPAERQSPELVRRLEALSQGLQQRREALARQSVLVERTLHLIVPATQEQTYGKAATPYGSSGRPSGNSYEA